MRALLSNGAKNSENGGPEASESKELLRLLRAEGFGIARRSYGADASMSVGEGEAALYVLTSGIALLSRVRSAGKEATLGLLKDWDVFGPLEFSEDPIRQLEFRAVTPCEVAKLPRPLLEAALRRNPLVALKVLTLQDAQLTRYEEFVARISSRSIPERLSALLLFLSERFPAGSPAGLSDASRAVTIGVRFTQEELAAMTVTTRESVTHTLRDLRRRGAIEVRGGTITVVDAEELREISGTQITPAPRTAPV